MTKDEALDLALDALDDLLYWDNGKPEYDKAREAITAIKQARSAPVQEPVAWMQDSIELYVQDRPSAYYTIPLYTTPPAAVVNQQLTTEPAAPIQEPPPECQTEAEKRAYAFGWWKALEANRAAPVQEPVDCCANCLRPEHEHQDGRCPKPFTTIWNAWDYDFSPTEPVAYTTGHCKQKAQPGGCQLHNLHCGYPACDRKTVTTPPAAQRQWVGLTRDEVLTIGRQLGLKCRLGGNANIDFDYADSIETKLKEKNT